MKGSPSGRAGGPRALAAALGSGLVLHAASAWAQPLPGEPPAGQPMPVLPPEPPAAPPNPPEPGAAPPAPSAPPAPEEAPAPAPPDGPELSAAPPPIVAPPPGGPGDLPAPPPPPPSVFAAAPGKPLAGYHGRFFLRNRDDLIRFYPLGRIHMDLRVPLGPGVAEARAESPEPALAPGLFFRRLRFEFAGEILRRVQFLGGFDFGDQDLSNAGGREQTAAAPPGADPTASSASFADVQEPANEAEIANAFINYEVRPWLNFMFGQHQAPFSLENRMSSNESPLIERRLAVRAFAAPEKEIGVTVWGDIGERLVSYEVGVFAGDGQNRPRVDARADLIGRVFSRPFSGQKKSPLAKAQVGASFRHGQRDDARVGYDHPEIETAGGFALWEPEYEDSLGRTIHVIPSGAQNALGLELRLPVGRFELRAEGFYLRHNTREAVEGFQLTNTERLGFLEGLGYYVHLSAWPLGDAFVTGDPGYVRPVSVDLDEPLPAPKRGLELVASLSGIDAEYNGSDRENSTPDPNTPGGNDSTFTPNAIDVLELGFAANYWWTRHFRASIELLTYATPGAGEGKNLAALPARTPYFELGSRLAVMF